MRNITVPNSVLIATESALLAAVFKTAYLLPVADESTVTIKVTLNDDNSVTATVKL